MNTQATFRDFLKLHFVVVLLGFTAILGQLTEVSSLAIVAYRTFIALVGLRSILFFKKKTIQLPTKSIGKMLGVGFILAVHWMCFFGSARIATVAISLVCFSTTSFFTSLIEPLFEKKKISWIEVLLGILVIIGISFVFTFEFQYINGILVGLFGGFLAAVFSVLNVRFARSNDAQVVTFYEMSGAFLSSLVLIPIFIGLNPSIEFQLIPTTTDWLWLLILGVVCTVYAYTEMLSLLKKISAFTLNLSINLEPIYGILLAFLIFGEKEKMTSGFYIGAGFILTSVLLHPLLLSTRKSK